MDGLLLVGTTCDAAKHLKRFLEEELPTIFETAASGQLMNLPVQPIRWTHDKIHGQMVFGNGRRADGSVYELVHDILSGHKVLEHVPPLEIVIHEQKLFSLNNRRLTALKMVQAVWQHQLLRVPCKLFHDTDHMVARRFHNAKTTTPMLGDGLGVLLNGHQQQAWHMGKPLFRCAQEWCAAALPDNEVGVTPVPQQSVRTNPAEQRHDDGEIAHPRRPHHDAAADARDPVPEAVVPKCVERQQSSGEHLRENGWTKYISDERREWWWHEESEGFFMVDECPKNGWLRCTHKDPELGQVLWFLHEASGRWFQAEGTFEADQLVPVIAEPDSPGQHSEQSSFSSCVSDEQCSQSSDETSEAQEESRQLKAATQVPVRSAPLHLLPTDPSPPTVRASAADVCSAVSSPSPAEPVSVVDDIGAPQAAPEILPLGCITPPPTMVAPTIAADAGTPRTKHNVDKFVPQVPPKKNSPALAAVPIVPPPTVPPALGAAHTGTSREESNGLASVPRVPLPSISPEMVADGSGVLQGNCDASADGIVVCTMEPPCVSLDGTPADSHATGATRYSPPGSLPDAGVGSTTTPKLAPSSMAASSKVDASELPIPSRDKEDSRLPTEGCVPTRATAKESEPFAVGDLVEIEGLHKTPHLNGCMAQLVRFVPAKNRWALRLWDSLWEYWSSLPPILVKPENLKRWAADSEADPSEVETGDIPIANTGSKGSGSRQEAGVTTGVSAKESEPFAIGERVRIEGLLAHPELNGCLAELVHYVQEKHRWTVRVLDSGCSRTVSVKLENLRRETTPELHAAVASEHVGTKVDAAESPIPDTNNKDSRSPQASSGPAGVSGKNSESLVAGEVMRIEGLRARPELNGCLAKLQRFIPEKDRWAVRVLDSRSSQTVLVRVENLRREAADPGTNTREVKGGSSLGEGQMLDAPSSAGPQQLTQAEGGKKKKKPKGGRSNRAEQLVEAPASTAQVESGCSPGKGQSSETSSSIEGPKQPAQVEGGKRKKKKKNAGGSSHGEAHPVEAISSTEGPEQFAQPLEASSGIAGPQQLAQAEGGKRKKVNTGSSSHGAGHPMEAPSSIERPEQLAQAEAGGSPGKRLLSEAPSIAERPQELAQADVGSSLGEVQPELGSQQEAAAAIEEIHGVAAHVALAAPKLIAPDVDYSALHPGLKLAVESDGELFNAEVVEVSTVESRANAPVKVHYLGYDSVWDEWVGAQRLHSRHLKQAAKPAACTQESSGSSSLLFPGQQRQPKKLAVRYHGKHHKDQEPSDNLYIAGLPASVHHDAVKQMFTSAGFKVVRFRVWNDREDGALALVRLRSQEQAAAAITQFNGRAFAMVQGATDSHDAQTPAYSQPPQNAVHLDGQDLADHVRPVQAPHGSSEDASSDEDDFYRDEEDDEAQEGEEPDANGEDPAWVYETEAVLRADMARQPDAPRIVEVTNMVVCGTFRCVADTSFKSKGSRGVVVVAEGPRALLGCRVQVMGRLNRNCAYDCDRCWVRILLAKCSRPENAMRHQHTDSAPFVGEHATLYGRVVRAEEYGAPRQQMVVCSRSTIVRNTKHVLFRSVNGKFPLISVPWDSTKLPNMFDLHVIEIMEWRGEKLPRGRHVESLHMNSRTTDASIMYPVQVSMNFCDWEQGEVRTTQDVANPVGSKTVKSMKRRGSWSFESQNRVDLRGSPAKCFAIEHKGWPVSVAFSMHSEGGSQLNVHVLDVNEYLDVEQAAHVEGTMRRRGIGLWLTDYLDQPVDAALSLTPDSVDQHLSFKPGSENAAITFSFPVDKRTGTFSIDAKSGSHFESIVQCDDVLSFVEAGQMICSEEEFGAEELGNAVRQMFSLVEHFMACAVEENRSFVLDHVDPDFTARSKATQDDPEGKRGALLAGRMVNVCNHLVHRYVAQVISSPAAWSSLVQDEEFQSRQSILAYAQGKHDPAMRTVIDRLLVRRSAIVGSDFFVNDVVKFMKKVTTSDRDLTYQQQHALQTACLGRLRAARPYASYMFVNPSTWSPACRGRQAPQVSDSVFFSEPVFHVTAPLRRYLDVVGMRVLKLKGGWKPTQEHIFYEEVELAKVVAASNARQDAGRFAQYIFRQVTLLRELATSGWQVKNVAIGPVGPLYFDVLVPLLTRDGLQIRVPVAAVRGLAYNVEYSADKQSLNVACFRAHESASSSIDTARWSIQPWKANNVSCIINRNFAQPLPHHASGTSLAITDLAFAPSSASEPVNVGIAHKMYPEVFSLWPDLGTWHLIDRDIKTYATLWTNIRRCQVHAAACTNSIYTPRTCARRLQFFENRGSHQYRCLVPRLCAPDSDMWIDVGDLAILRCTDPRKDGAAILYGQVEEAWHNATQFKTKRCWHDRCTNPDCTFAHDDAELGMKQFRVEVRLSDISVAAWKQQSNIFEAASKECIDVQFISIPLSDKKGLELVSKMPKSSASTAIGAVLTSAQTPQQKKHEQERRPLATVEQVEQALQFDYFHVNGGSQLNDRQSDAVKKALQRHFSVVQGPPGTGKTTFLVHLMMAILNLEANASLYEVDGQWNHVTSRRGRAHHTGEPGKILLCTPSNHAADEVVLRLVRDSSLPASFITRVYARSIERAHGSTYKGGAPMGTVPDMRFVIRPELEEHSLHFKARYHRNVNPRQDSLPEDDPDNAAAAQQAFDAVYEDAESEILRRCRIVVTTCSSALLHTALSKGTSTRLRRTVPFATVVIDEAAQASEPDVVLPAYFAEQRVVIVGDHKQLGPVVTEKNMCKAFFNALQTPFLERMLKAPDRLPANTLLNRQYRMHPSIRMFPSKQFYDSQLLDEVSHTPGPMPKCLFPKEDEHVVFIDCEHPHGFGLVVEDGRRSSMSATLMENNTSLKNTGEAQLVVDVYNKLLKHCACGPGDIGIITPYRAQQQEIRERLGKLVGVVSKDTAVGTVHALQGSEREYIILSFVRSVAEESIFMQDTHIAAATDVVASVDSRNPALRQICEGNIGILADSKLLNVSLTRAKHGLICIGNRAVLSQGSNDFLDLADALEERGCLLSKDQFRNLAPSAAQGPATNRRVSQ